MGKDVPCATCLSTHGMLSEALQLCTTWPVQQVQTGSGQGQRYGNVAYGVGYFEVVPGKVVQAQVQCYWLGQRQGKAHLGGSDHDKSVRREQHSLIGVHRFEVLAHTKAA